MSVPDDIPSFVRTLVEPYCPADVFARMSQADQRNVQMLVVFEFMLGSNYAEGINALLPAKDICAKTPVGVGWGQVGATRTALVNAVLKMGVPMSQSEDTEVLRRAADSIVDELVAAHS